MKSIKKAIISGIGISRIGRRTETPALDLTLEASRAAIADAGLTAADIDGAAILAATPVDEVLQALGIEASYKGAGYGRAGVMSLVIDSAAAIESGRARHILVNRTVKMMGGTMLDNSMGPRNFSSSSATPAATPTPPASATLDIPVMLAYHAYSAANYLGMHLRRHMHLYGTRREQLGALAVNSRRNAKLNPRAIYQDEITLDDYMNARMVSAPLGLLDCDVPVDGAVSLVLSIPEYASDCPKPAVRIASTGGSIGSGGWTMRPDYPRMASYDAAAELWSKTDLKPADVDFGEIYDGFSYLTLAWLEALGICKEGEGGPFLEGGQRIAMDGEFPINTYGGQLSAGRMHGYWTIHEACTQLRGEAGARQLKKKRLDVGLVSGGGGPIAGCMLLTR